MREELCLAPGRPGVLVDEGEVSCEDYSSIEWVDVPPEQVKNFFKVEVIRVGGPCPAARAAERN